MDAFYSGPSAAPYGAPRRGGGWRYDSFKNFSQISPAVQTHLKLVRTPLSLFPSDVSSPLPVAGA
jgi:hypothetical protein